MTRFTKCGLIVCALFPLLAQAGSEAALEFFRQGEAAFAGKQFDQATDLYTKAIAESAQDGVLVIGTETVERTVGEGRFARKVTAESVHEAEYFPNRRLQEITRLRIEEVRRQSPPELRVTWMTLNEPTRDDVLDGGERGALVVTVENTGVSQALDVFLDIEADERNGLEFPRRLDIGNIAPSESSVANIQVAAARDIKNVSRQIHITARERDGHPSNRLTVALRTRPHEPAQLAISDIQVTDLTGDGQIEPMETVWVTAMVSNIGKGVTNSLIARLDVGNNVFLGPENNEPLVLGELFPGQARKVEFSFLTNRRFEEDQKIPATLRVVDVSDTRHAEKDLSVYAHIPRDKVGLYAKRSLNTGSVDEPIPTADFLLPRRAERNPNAVAVVIGNRNYAKAGLPAVKYAHNDARAIKEYLVHAMGVDEQNILYVEDATAASFSEIFGTHDVYAGKLNSYLKPGVSDVFVYYSGHGAPDLNNQGAYFVPVDADPAYIAMSGYSLDLFYRNVAKLPARAVTIVLDTCFSGNTDGGFLLSNVSPAAVRVKTDGPAISNANIFTSARGQQVSAWFHEKRHGLFTYYFLKGLSGAADEDSDKVVTSTELGAFLATEVSHQARRKYGLEQVPLLIERQPLNMARFGD